VERKWTDLKQNKRERGRERGRVREKKKKGGIINTRDTHIEIL
jgi:hypothetical protein